MPAVIHEQVNRHSSNCPMGRSCSSRQLRNNLPNVSDKTTDISEGTVVLVRLYFTKVNFNNNQLSSDNNITTDSHKEGITLFKILRITAVDNMDFDHITIVAYCKCTVLRPVYTGDFCGHFSHSDACD